MIPLFITRLLRSESPIIYGDGRQSRDFTYVANVVHANLLAADAPGAAGNTFNIANGLSTSLLELIEALSRLLGVYVQPTHQAPRAGDVRHSKADIALARKLLGYEPQVDLDEGLRSSIAYYRKP